MYADGFFLVVGRCTDGESLCGGNCLAYFHICRRLGAGLGCFSGPGGFDVAGGRVRDLTAPSGRHCHGIAPVFRGGRPSVASVAGRRLLHRYEHVFPAPGEPVTGRTRSVQHEILTSDARPVQCGPRRLAPARTCVKEMLSGGQIEPSDSPWASPVVLVTMKDGSTRFCVGYCRLNSLTVKDAYPLPHIDDSLRLLGNQQWFSTMYLASGYWQVVMSPEAKRKAAFVTNEGLFQFRVMPFGLCNAPATFECLMDRVLCGMR